MIILDLDNCISDDAWRVPFIDWTTDDMYRRYEKYHSLCELDDFKNCQLIDSLHGIIILTARPRKVEAMTIRWLKRWSIPCALLLMRNDNEHKRSVDLKREQLLALPSLGLKLVDIYAAYDDRPEVVEMYKMMGINGQVSAIHNVETERTR
jgi:hypothetical protein